MGRARHNSVHKQSSALSLTLVFTRVCGAEDSMFPSGGRDRGFDPLQTRCKTANDGSISSGIVIFCRLVPSISIANMRSGMNNQAVLENRPQTFFLLPVFCFLLTLFNCSATVLLKQACGKPMVRRKRSSLVAFSGA